MYCLKPRTNIQLVFARREHAAVLKEIFSGKAMQAFSPVGSMSVGELSEQLAYSGRDFSKPASFYRLFARYNDQWIGSLIFKNIEDHRAEVGFGLLDHWQGQGLGPQLLAQCLELLFSESSIQHLWATVSHDNIPCQKTLEKNGFQRDPDQRRVFFIQERLVQQYVYVLERASLKPYS